MFPKYTPACLPSGLFAGSVLSPQNLLSFISNYESPLQPLGSIPATATCETVGFVSLAAWC